MAEYIERGETQKAMQSVTEDTTCPLHIAAEIDQILSLVPSADVRSERHGRWIKDGDVLVCSECGEEHAWGDYRATYCEDCGAKMDGKE